MGFFKKLFGSNTNSKTNNVEQEKVGISVADTKRSEYEEVPGFIEAVPEECKLVSVIASAIAAGDYPESAFEIRRILKRNPEATLISVVALSLAAGNNPDSQFIIQNIKKRRA